MSKQNALVNDGEATWFCNPSAGIHAVNGIVTDWLNRDLIEPSNQLAFKEPHVVFPIFDELHPQGHSRHVLIGHLTGSGGDCVHSKAVRWRRKYFPVLLLARPAKLH